MTPASPVGSPACEFVKRVGLFAAIAALVAVILMPTPAVLLLVVF